MAVLVLVTYAHAQEGHPLTGTWAGDCGASLALPVTSPLSG